MKPTEFDVLVNSASSSSTNSSSSSNNRAGLSSGKRRNGFPPITREARSRTRRWLLFLILVLILLFLGWRFFIRPSVFPLEDRPPETIDRNYPSLSTTQPPPYINDYDNRRSTYETKLNTKFMPTTTPFSQKNWPKTTQQDSNSIDFSVTKATTAVPWPGLPSNKDKNDESSSYESKFKIEADLNEKDEVDKKQQIGPNQQIQHIVTGFYDYNDASSNNKHPTTRTPINQNDYNKISTTTSKKISYGQEENEDYEDENQIWFNRKPVNNGKEKTAAPNKHKYNPAAKAHPSVNLATSTSTTASPSTTQNQRRFDGLRIVHPHANAGAGNWQTTTPPATTIRQKFRPNPIEPTKNDAVDADLKDLINELDKEIPVWRIEPKDMPAATPPPKPADDENDKKPKFPSFSIQASVQTIPAVPVKDYGFKPPIDHSDRRHRIDKRSDTPVIVTGLLNIGRGDWIRFTRPYDMYLDYLMDLLKLDNRFIIFCDKEAEEFLVLQKDLDWERLQIVSITLNDLPFYRYRDEIAKIIDYEQRNWNESWDQRFKDHPEALFPDYNILVNSKPYLLHNATQISRFESEYFVWVDAGYSHGSKDIIPHTLWDPELKPGKITVIKVTNELDKPERYTLEMVYRKRWDVISGGFLAGDAATIRRFSVFFFKTFMSLLDQGRSDDDQTVLLMTIKNYASTFNILVGGWFDAFKLVPSRNYDSLN